MKIRAKYQEILEQNKISGRNNLKSPYKIKTKLEFNS